MATPVMELQARTGDEVADRAGNEDFTSASQIGDPCCGMHRYAADVIVANFDLAGMEAAAHFDPKWSKSLNNCSGAAHTSGGSIKGGEKAVAQRFHLSSAEACQFLTHRLVMSRQ